MKTLISVLAMALTGCGMLNQVGGLKDLESCGECFSGLTKLGQFQGIQQSLEKNQSYREMKLAP